jgi:sulfite oxidase
MRLLPFQQLLRTKNVASNRLVAQSFGNFRPAFLTLFDGRVSRPLPVGRGRRCFSIEATQQAKKSSYGSSQSANTLGWYSLVGGALAAAATASLCAQSSPEGSANNSWDDQNIFTMKEVSEHNSMEKGVWVTYKDGVYDVTDFIKQHPGGSERIMLAAGSSVDPFWTLYQQHFTKDVQAILKQYQIGRLDPTEVVEVDPTDPYSTDPKRHPALFVHKEKPFNAETPTTLITDESYITPNELWYVRHHHPVPVVDPKTYRLVIEGKGLRRRVELSLEDLKTLFKKHTVTATMQCGGNRRGQFNKISKAQGLPWKQGAISTATWGGVLLRDILAWVGVDEETAERVGIEHIHMYPLDPPYDASIPLDKAVNRKGDVLLAYEMNGQELPPDHGYPLRSVVPGGIGARQVKWLTKIVTSDEESPSVWQRSVQYKGFSPNVTDFKNVDPSKVLSCQEMPVQSCIVNPSDGAECVSVEDDDIDVAGFAWSGGGRSIVRVDVSADGGKTWITANLGKGADQKNGRAWAWTLWEATVPLKEILKGRKKGDKIELLCKAVDSSYNQQPEKAESLWNLRGILNNSWHRINVSVGEA